MNQGMMLDKEKKMEILGKESKQSGWRAKRLIFFVPLFCLGGAVWYIGRLATGPAVGIITDSKPGHSLVAPGLSLAPREFKGKYFTLLLNESYREKGHEITDDLKSNIRESVLFAEDTMASHKLAVTIERVPEGGIWELSSYAFRVLHPDEYRKEAYEWDRDGGIFFRKDSQVYEIIGYIEKNGISASISISSPIDTPEKLIGDFSDIMKSFRWTDTQSQ